MVSLASAALVRGTFFVPFSVHVGYIQLFSTRQARVLKRHFSVTLCLRDEHFAEEGWAAGMIALLKDPPHSLKEDRAALPSIYMRYMNEQP